MTLAPVASFWSGPDLTFLEQVSLKSFADMGHPTTLYSYEEIGNIPESVVLKDARDILPEFKIFPHFRTIAAFSDRFRIEMIKKTGEIWVDADVACIKPFPMQDYLFAQTGRYFGNAVLKLPQSSKALGELSDFLAQEDLVFKNHWKSFRFFQRRPDLITQIDRDHFAFIDVATAPYHYTLFGAVALTHYLHLHGEQSHQMPSNSFYPFHAMSLRGNYSRPRRPRIVVPEECYGVHHIGGKPFRKKWDQRGEFAPPHPGSFIGRLCDKHGIDPLAAPYVPKVNNRD